MTDEEFLRLAEDARQALAGQPTRPEEAREELAGQPTRPEEVEKPATEPRAEPPLFAEFRAWVARGDFVTRVRRAWLDELGAEDPEEVIWSNGHVAFRFRQGHLTAERGFVAREDWLEPAFLKLALALRFHGIVAMQRKQGRMTRTAYWEEFPQTQKAVTQKAEPGNA